MPLRAGGKGEKNATRIAQWPGVGQVPDLPGGNTRPPPLGRSRTCPTRLDMALMRQLRGEGAQGKRDADQQWRARRIARKQNLRREVAGRTFDRRLYPI